MDDVIYLITQTYTKDEYGVRRAEETKKQVFVKIRNITRAEFFDGGRNGLNPQMRFDVFSLDYNGESILEWRGKRYGIYRTSNYDSEDYTELYVERKGGTNGTAQESPAH